MAPKSNENDLVISSDFSSVKISIGLTVTAKRPGVRPLVGKDEPRMIEVRDDGVTLDLPADFCQAGDRLLFQVSATTPEGKKGSFSSPAQVVSIEAAEGERVAASIQYLLASGGAWATFRELLDSRQNEIEEFLRAARGY